MTITRRQRRRILLALLPLLAFVWAALPALPCCHELGTAAGDPAVVGGMSAHHDHHPTSTVDDGFAIEHGANHCEEAPAATLAPPCTDIEKTSNDLRPVHFAGVMVVLTTVLPALRTELESRAPLPYPSPPPRYRPLHLEKSVLLI